MILLFFTICFTGSAGAGSFIEYSNDGRIDWSGQTFHSSGTGVPSADTPLAREQAFTTARRNAYRNLLETVKSVRLTSSFTVRQAIRDRDDLLASLEEILKNAEITNTRYMSDGTVEILKQIPMNGAFSQLMLPEAIVQLEMKKMGWEKLNADDENVYTGLVVDARRIEVKPSICMKIVDEKGREVYGPAYVSREYAVQRGMCEYRTQMEDIIGSERVGDNPLIVQGLKSAESGKADIVISNSDASRLRSTVDHLFLLRKCRVIVIAEPIHPESGQSQ